jgi:hypothetical protein
LWGEEILAGKSGGRSVYNPEGKPVAEPVSPPTRGGATLEEIFSLCQKPFQDLQVLLLCSKKIPQVQRWLLLPAD